MKRNLLLAIFSLFLVSAAFGQNNVRGTVYSGEDGEPLPGVNVIVKGTTVGTQTNIDGEFAIEVPEDNQVLVFSFIGMQDQEVNVAGMSQVNVTLEAAALGLDEVVVTALGISREKKALGYSTQEVGGEEVNRAKDANFMNSLTGKVSGVNIQKSNTLGGSSNIVIRGYKSLTGNNQPLFVVDGIPISNNVGNTSDQRTGRGGYDYGNAAMDVNPEDIESINVLKGAAATALYGSRAANGAIIITTKKGAKGQGLGITYNTGFTVGSIDKTTMPTYQTGYGAGYGRFYGSDPANFPDKDPNVVDGYFVEYDVDGDGNLDLTVPMGEDASYGAPFDPNMQVYTWESIHPELSTYGQTQPHQAAENLPTEFYESALTWNNSIGISGGTDDGTYRLSYTNFDQNGIVPNSELKKNVVTFGGTYTISDRWDVSSSVSYINQQGRGRYGTGYDSRNFNQSFRQWYYVSVDMEAQREAYENTGLNMTWNPYGYGAANPTAPHYFDNFYWTAYENFSTDERDRIFGNIEVNYELNDWINIKGRASLDNFSEIREERIAVGSVDVPLYSRRNIGFAERNFDLIAQFNRYFGTDDIFNLGGNVGMNIRRTSYESFYAQTNGGLIVPNVYALSNSVNPIIVSNANPIVDNNKRMPDSEVAYDIGTNGYFAQVNMGYDQFLYLDLTGRYDVASTLPAENNSYFYPSASLSLVFSELVGMDFMNFGKLRLNYAEVGNSAPAQSIFNTYSLGTPFNGIPLASVPSTQNNAELKPENTVSWEIGVETQFINNRAGLDITLYKSNTFNQIIPVSVSPSTGRTFQYVNAGNIENRGIEVALMASPVSTDAFSWDIRVNWSKNVNEVVELFEDQTNLQLASVQGGITINAAVGEPYGTIKGTNFVYHDNGEPIVTDHPFGGAMYVSSSEPEVIGNMMPDWYGGVQNILSFKGVTMSFLVDFQKGGNFFSLDTWYGYATGLYDVTAGTNDKGNPVRDNPDDGGGVNIGGVTQTGTDAEGNPISDGTANTKYAYADDVYSSLGYVLAPNAYHVYDASFVKLREVTLGYSLPSSMFQNNFIGGIDVSLVGRNLWIIHKNAPYTDPEAGLSAGNIQGYQSGAYPSVREMGINLRVKF